LESTVQMVGAADQSEVLAWWQRASVAVLTSEREGMPVCLMEAAACGVPVVATAAGGIPELVVDGVTGLLAPPGDRIALAAALQRLLENPDMAARMGAAARKGAKRRFSVSRQVDRLLQLWSGLLREEVKLCRSR
jgi:glycosyltransferase involved in cell wall biosynthesis